MDQNKWLCVHTFIKLTQRKGCFRKIVGKKRKPQLLLGGFDSLNQNGECGRVNVKASNASLGIKNAFIHKGP